MKFPSSEGLKKCVTRIKQLWTSGNTTTSLGWRVNINANFRDFWTNKQSGSIYEEIKKGLFYFFPQKLSKVMNFFFAADLSNFTPSK